MQISAEGRIGLAFTLVLGVGGGLVAALPMQVWIGWSIVTFSVAGLLWLAGYQFAGIGVGPLSDFLLGRIRLRAAARIAFEAGEGSTAERIQDELDDDSADERINRHVLSMLNRKVPMWGRSPPSRKFRPIMPALLPNLRWVPGEDSLRPYSPSTGGRLTDVRVSRGALKEYIKSRGRLSDELI